MYKRLTLIIFILSLLVGFLAYITYLNTPYSKNLSETGSLALAEEKPSAFAEALLPVYENPAKLVISSIQLNLDLVRVGTLEDGSLEAPKDWNTGGWYVDGSRAGEPGNLILDAHYDDSAGRPAAFWLLKNIKTGDIVTVLDTMGKSFDYEVSEIFYVDINDPARTQIFENDTSKAHVTLITCGGIWLSGHGTYSQRLVVKGDLLEKL
ncbi:MAG: peptidase C60 sortase A and B [uncultured bacterium]|uniref:Sortase n=1 Tax=candidate division WWE3 bacterium RBG_16_37_10 TaxID=1802610 RepID=A0A1F4UTF3_UNCKA|nr:MAG: peptidase C60 sortase A and B [uncultured bacterium]OGC48219.1 MAG: hypothetical protein A2W32_02470 [candidate division WWE3 bacterium RBG_16_37_10]